MERPSQRDSPCKRNVGLVLLIATLLFIGVSAIFAIARYNQKSNVVIKPQIQQPPSRIMDSFRKPVSLPLRGEEIGRFSFDEFHSMAGKNKNNYAKTIRELVKNRKRPGRE